MESIQALSFAIRDYEINHNPNNSNLSFGYITKDGRGPFDNYLSNKSFEQFIRSFSNNHFKQFSKGDGNELKERKYKGSNYPPKMAAFASSSRMVYDLSKDIAGFTFEKQLQTNMGGNPANLDGYLHSNNSFCFVEAKRKEIYGSHSKIREAYRELFEYISKDNSNPLTINSGKSDEKNNFKAHYYNNKQEIKYFDLKQMISHMLGISNEFLQANDNLLLNDEKIQFIYLIYNPNDSIEYALTTKKEYFNNANKKTITERYLRTKEEIESVDMRKLFSSIVQYTINNKVPCKQIDANKLINSFSFELTDQHYYKESILQHK